MREEYEKSEIKYQINSEKWCEELNCVTSVWGIAAKLSLDKVFLHSSKS